jgi:hypothetical protein
MQTWDTIQPTKIGESGFFYRYRLTREETPENNTSLVS